ncbi:MAG: hypothetical protein ACXADL_13955 [Candidatus Thorarchaeota archaeon]|jgi:predicted HTH transcriptional regulator
MIEKTPESYAEYKAKRIEIIKQIDYNQGQVSYHKAKLAYLEQELVELEDKHERWQEKLHQEKGLENKWSIQEVANMLAIDRAKIEDKILTSKAEKLLRQMMKGFK